jgi:hypothetical protein
MFRTTSRIALLALPLGLAGCVVATPYDNGAYYAGPPAAVVVEHPEYRWARPTYRVEEHVYVRDHPRYSENDRYVRHDRHDDHDRGHGRGNDHDRDHDHD